MYRDLTKIRNLGSCGYTEHPIAIQDATISKTQGERMWTGLVQPVNMVYEPTSSIQGMSFMTS